MFETIQMYRLPELFLLLGVSAAGIVFFHYWIRN